MSLSVGRIAAGPNYWLREEVIEAARALEGFEEEAGLDVLAPLIGMELKKLMAAFGVGEHAQDAGLGEVQIAETMALILVEGAGINRVQGLEEQGADGFFYMRSYEHKNFFGLARSCQEVFFSFFRPLTGF